MKCKHENMRHWKYYFRFHQHRVQVREREILKKMTSLGVGMMMECRHDTSCSCCVLETMDSEVILFLLLFSNNVHLSVGCCCLFFFSFFHKVNCQKWQVILYCPIKSVLFNLSCVLLFFVFFWPQFWQSASFLDFFLCEKIRLNLPST